MIIGYGRVSTDGQPLEAQEALLKAAGAERIFAEKISGAITDRKALAKAIASLGPGDVLLVTRLDRLARSTRDLLNAIDTPRADGAKLEIRVGIEQLDELGEISERTGQPVGAAEGGDVPDRCQAAQPGARAAGSTSRTTT